MKICTKCGAQARDEERFCMKCFSVLPDATSLAPRKTDPVKLVIESNIKPSAQGSAKRKSMTYDSSSPIKKEEALNIITKAHQILEVYVETVSDSSMYMCMQNDLAIIYNKIEQGEIPPLEDDHKVHLLTIADFFMRAAMIIDENFSDDESQHTSRLYERINNGLTYICINGIEKTQDNKTEDKKDKSTEETVWHPDVKEEIESLKKEMGRLCPTFKMHAYKEGHDYWQELDDLIGLDSVKHTLREHIHAYEAYLERKKRHPELKSDFKFNCIFKGRPGTGKTTVARIVAGILKSEGVIKCGHYIETDMSTLGTTWIGMTPKFARLAALQAVGGVLFFDEAYTLMKKSHSDRNGEEIVDTLTPILSKYGGDIVMILAGYEDEMDKMLQSVNPGFASRFQKSVVFEDYTSTEMYEIFKMAAEREFYRIDQEAETRLLALLHIIEMKKNKNRAFANARTANSLFELVRAKASARFIADRNTDPDLITAADAALTKEELRSIGAI